MPRPPPAARMVATMVTTAIHRAHGCGGAGIGGGAYAGGGIQPSGAGGGAGDSCGTSSRDCGSNSEDRKSTRLNSSHRCISYAVFCLKKKKKKYEHRILSQGRKNTTLSIIILWQT